MSAQERAQAWQVQLAAARHAGSTIVSESQTQSHHTLVTVGDGGHIRQTTDNAATVRTPLPPTPSVAPTPPTPRIPPVPPVPPVPPIPPIPHDIPPYGTRLGSSTLREHTAPGILDRRKSTKLVKPSKSRERERGIGKRGSPPPPITFTMADSEAVVEVREEDMTPGQESDAFEDASESTPKPVAAVPHVEALDEAAGLAINGAEDTAPSTIEVAALSNGDAKGTHSRQTTVDITPSLDSSMAASPPRDRSVSPSKRARQTMKGLSGDFVVTAPPPPSTSDRVHALDARQPRDSAAGASPRPTDGFARKASSGLSGLLGRMGSIRRPAKSPPARSESKIRQERVNTNGSMASLNESVNGMASIADESETSSLRPSLRDQFQDVRRREEHTIDELDNAVDDAPQRSPIGRKHSDAGILSRMGDDGLVIAPAKLGRAASTPGPLKSPTLDPKLPPGTASGITAGPADEPRPVNWDLWQTVVYEGPAAVRRTSGEELRQAIAAGIPPAIRGVVWQVLAESKNEELEAVYHTLKTRGTDAEQLRPAPATRTHSQSGLLNGTALEKESVASSTSSVHSVESTTATPATSAVASPPISVDGNPLDIQGKLVVEKQKRDSAALLKLEKAIRRDMGSRTSFSKYTQSAGLQESLFNNCKAYALFDEGVGYAQGINFITMPLLFNLSEEESFTLLVKLMSGYDLRSMFTPEMSGLHLRLYQFERLLEDLEPALYCHLRRRKVDPQLYATQWFLTLFAYRFPLQLVLRVYDLIFSEGLTAILKFGIVLMQRNREALLAMKDMSQLSAFLKEKIFDVYIDKSPSASSLLDSGFFGSVTGGADKELYRADEMVRDACNIEIAEAQLALYTSEWEDQQRTTLAQTTELENLRTANSSLTSRLKNLEERSQAQDTEHVTLASELVRLKVQLDEVLDESEGLKMQVQQLQGIVDTQPGLVEAKLKEEMERIMARNLEVQGQNRGLMEEQEEMERELVGAKMALAQLAHSRPTAFQTRFYDVGDTLVVFNLGDALLGVKDRRPSKGVTPEPTILCWLGERKLSFPARRTLHYTEDVDRVHFELGLDTSKLVFNHKDLGSTNIMVDVEDNCYIGIVDWEMAGFVPLLGLGSNGLLVLLWVYAGQGLRSMMLR
ncbi:hypothetical protein LTR62_006206 [Meristemomyces frigidus]|uniref:GTPase-activating protein GYP5 n=1 Tax=Meristemomyces frigidus TaxID=1508187 RepID=A0AAN7TK67_9PEZI|nr:hypothetical protein LTR62_006206 [Meristemomyces frigidus]